MSGPQTYKYVEIRDLPTGLQFYANGVRNNFNWVASSVNSLVSASKATDAEVAKKAPTANPLFSGRIGIPTVIADPGNPPAGQSWMFVLVATGVSSDLIVRHNDAGTIREATIPLT